MQAYWLNGKNRSGCVEAPSEVEARTIFQEKTGAEAASCQTLPYPANPRIHIDEHPKFGICPAFCYKPRTCAGRTACPRRPACDS